MLRKVSFTVHPCAADDDVYGISIANSCDWGRFWLQLAFPRLKLGLRELSEIPKLH